MNNNDRCKVVVNVQIPHGTTEQEAILMAARFAYHSHCIAQFVINNCTVQAWNHDVKGHQASVMNDDGSWSMLVREGERWGKFELSIASFITDRGKS
jgi:hypothetical protein